MDWLPTPRHRGLEEAWRTASLCGTKLGVFPGWEVSCADLDSSITYTMKMRMLPDVVLEQI